MAVLSPVRTQRLFFWLSPKVWRVQGIGPSGSTTRSRLGTVVAWIEAGVVRRAVDPNPVSPVDPLTILSDRTDRESAGHLKPPVLRSSNGPDLPRDFRQILVLTENYGNIVGVLPGQSDHVDGDADVDALLFAREITVFRAAGQADNLVPVDKGPGVDGGATPAEVGELVGPEVVPEGVIFTVGNTRVEADLGKFPPMRIRDGGSQRDGIEIGIRVTEGMPCGVIEVLAVEEHDGPLRRGLSPGPVGRNFIHNTTTRRLWADLHVRPIHHREPDRVRAHIFLCMLAYYVEGHMRQDLAPLLFADDDKAAAEQARASVVAPAQRSPSAQQKASSRRTPDDLPVHSFQTLLNDLATIVASRVQQKDAAIPAFDILTTPTAVQQRALDLLRVSIKLPEV